MQADLSFACLIGSKTIQKTKEVIIKFSVMNLGVGVDVGSFWGTQNFLFINLVAAIQRDLVSKRHIYFV